MRGAVCTEDHLVVDIQDGACYKIEHPLSSDSLSKPSSFSISFISMWNTSATFSPVLLEHSRYGTPIDSASACASCHHVTIATQITTTHKQKSVR